MRDFALRIIEHLVGLDTKLVVVACNTATAAALNAARERFDVPVVGVIAPGAQAAVEATRNGRVAVISTEGTRASQEYVHAIKEANPGVGVLGLAVPELVDIIEAGEADGPRGGGDPRRGARRGHRLGRRHAGARLHPLPAAAAHHRARPRRPPR